MDIEQHRAFQRVEWAAQRAGWVVLASIVTAAALGLFGNGPLSSRQARSHDGRLEVSFDRYLRQHTANVLCIDIHPASPFDDLRLGLGQEFLNRVEPLRVDPQPQRQFAGDVQQIFVMSPAPHSTTCRVMLHFEPLQCGPLSAEVRLDDSTTVTIAQFVYP